MAEVLRQRMYHLVMYNISPIQQGIQAGHAVNEYQIQFGESAEYKQWSRKDKVVIILNGGTSNNIGKDVWGNECIGTMEVHEQTLYKNQIDYACFHEPDMNNSMTALAFLVDETVWDKDKYPNPVVSAYNSFYDWSVQDEQALVAAYGEKTAFLRTWLKQFRLA